MALLQAGSFDEIRACLDLSLDEETLPDSVIALESFSGAAESEIVARDPLATTYLPADAKAIRVLRALHYLTAARIAPALPMITAEKVGADSYSRAAWDGTKRAAELRGLAERELSAYLNVDGKTLPLQGMWLAPGRRGL